MIYDCFISYQHEDISFVEKLVGALEAKGVICWYAPRNIVGRYGKAISYGISHSKVFLLVLNSRSAISEDVLNEVELAHNNEKISKYSVIQPLCIEKMNFEDPKYQEMMYYIRRRQFIMATDDEAIDSIADSITNSQLELKKKKLSRSKSSYIVQEKETIRISKQNSLLDYFDKDVYFSVFKKYKCPIVLDIGCGNGNMLIKRLVNSKTDFSHYLGIDKSERQIRLAELNHKSLCKAHFLVCDIETGSFEESLNDYCSQFKIKSFDIINISMLLLHLENPGILLRTIKKYLSDNGTIIIRDIDDGINFAFPDSDNSFDRIYRMCEHDEQSGFRKTGRQIYYELINAGYSRVSLARQGLSTVGLTDEEKRTLFQTYFPFILENAKIMSEKYPWNKELAEDYQWYNNCYESIYERFMKTDFVFSLGFMTYTAQK